MNADLDTLLHDSLAAEAADVVPDTLAAWERLESGTKRRRWVRPGGVLVLTAAAAVAVVLAATGLSDDEAAIETGPAEEGTTPTTDAAPEPTPTPTPTPAPDPAEVTMPDGSPRFVANLRDDGAVMLLDRAEHEERRLIQLDPPGVAGGARRPRDLDVSLKHRMVFVGVYGEPPGGEILGIPFEGTDAPVVVGSGLDPAISPDGEWLATVDATSGSFAVTSLDTGQTLDTFSELDVSVADPSWSPDGTKLAVDMFKIDHGYVTAFDFDPERGLTKRTEIATLTGHPVWLDNETLLGVDQTGSCSDCAEPEPGVLRTVRLDGTLLEASGLGRHVRHLATDPTGRHVLLTDDAGAVTVVDTGEVLITGVHETADW